MTLRVFAGLVLVAAAPVLADSLPPGQLDAGVSAYAGGDYRKARQALRPLADQGSAIAETLLGVMAAEGRGSPQDPAVAVGWWLRAANRGYAPAQLALAKALAAGQGVAADAGAAWVWARLAEGGGSREAGVLADRLERGFSAVELERLEARREGWRPVS